MRKENLRNKVANQELRGIEREKKIAPIFMCRVYYIYSARKSPLKSDELEKAVLNSALNLKKKFTTPMIVT